MDGVLHPPLDVSDPDGGAGELGGEGVELDAVQNLRPDPRHGHAEAERLAIEDGAPQARISDATFSCQAGENVPYMF